MEKQQTPLIDEYLKSLEGISAVEPKDFFYARLIAKLENEKGQKDWVFPLKPIWMICTLVVFLLVNTLVLTNKSQQNTDDSSLASFASAYDQSISTY